MGHINKIGCYSKYKGFFKWVFYLYCGATCKTTHNDKNTIKYSLTWLITNKLSV